MRKRRNLALELHTSSFQSETSNVQILVTQVELAIFGYVAENVLSTVQVRDSDDLPANMIVQPVLTVRVDETVSHPHS